MLWALEAFCRFFLLAMNFLQAGVAFQATCMSNTKRFGSCHFPGIGPIGDTAYAVRFLDRSRMCYSTKLRLLQNAIPPLYGCHAGLLFARHSYLEASRLLAAEPPRKNAPGRKSLTQSPEKPSTCRTSSAKNRAARGPPSQSTWPPQSPSRPSGKRHPTARKAGTVRRRWRRWPPPW